MGYDAPGESAFRMPASDMQTYKQFGNSVVVPVFRAVAMLMKDRVIKGKVAAEKLKSGPLAA